MAGGWVYIICNKPHGVLYTGVTADLARRLWQHRAGEGGKFSRKYHCSRLVYVEAHDRIEDAIVREKAIKAWQRQWKLRLVQEHNPEWKDLWERIVSNRHASEGWHPGGRKARAVFTPWGPSLRWGDGPFSPP